MLKRIGIAAGFGIALIASVVGGWTAGKWLYGSDGSAPASPPSQAVADSTERPAASSVADAGQLAASDVADAPCDGADSANPCFRQVPDPLPLRPDTDRRADWSTGVGTSRPAATCACRKASKAAAA